MQIRRYPQFFASRPALRSRLHRYTRLLPERFRPTVKSFLAGENYASHV